MRVIVAGGVGWTNEEAIRQELRKLPAGSTVIHGDTTGADAIGGRIAAELGFVVEAMAKNREDYARYQRAAWKGLNERMLASGAELVLAFHAALAESRGSRHLVEIARASGVEVRIFAG